MENLPAVQNKNVAFIPQSIAGAMELAGIMARSGLMPKGIQTKEAVFVAMQMGLEIGLSPMAAVQNIAVIHNRPGLFGDVALAVVRGSGELEYFEEWSEGERKTPGWTFYCKIKRRGEKEAIGSYSWAEACEAGLDKADSASSWKKWTNRMMQFKARNFVMRDHFTDILKGIRTHEENVDAIDMEELSDVDGVSRYQVAPDVAAQEAEEAKTGGSVFHMTASENYQGDDLVKLSVFVKATAEVHGVADYIIEGRAMDNWAGFSAAFEAWKVKQAESSLPKEQPIEVDAPQVEKEAEGRPSDSAVWADFRGRYINLKTSGFAGFVLANKELFENCPAELLNEAKEKWAKLYTGYKWMTPISGLNGAGNGTAQRPQEQAVASPAVEAPAEQAVPLSYTRQYKDLMEFKNEFPTLYSQARIELAIGPDSIENCSRLHTKMEKLVEQQIAVEVKAEESDPPAGLDEFNQFG
jgi:hypothetical protein